VSAPVVFSDSHCRHPPRSMMSCKLNNVSTSLLYTHSIIVELKVWYKNVEIDVAYDWNVIAGLLFIQKNEYLLCKPNLLAKLADARILWAYSVVSSLPTMRLHKCQTKMVTRCFMASEIAQRVSCQDGADRRAISLSSSTLRTSRM